MRTISPAQLRAARAYLDWSHEEVMKRTGLASGTITRIEQQTGPEVQARVSTLSALVKAYEEGGIEFGERSVTLRG